MFSVAGVAAEIRGTCDAAISDDRTANTTFVCSATAEHARRLTREA
jgi:hypothetical protein